LSTHLLGNTPAPAALLDESGAAIARSIPDEDR
jgi:hypothetical protein